MYGFHKIPSILLVCRYQCFVAGCFLHAVEYRAAVEARIQAGGGEIGLDTAYSLLRGIDACPPPKTPLEWRVEYLESARNDPGHADDIENISAVLEGYRFGTIEYRFNHFYVFKDGKRVAGPLPASSLPDVLFKQFPDVKGRWIESCRGSLYLLPAFYRTITADPDSHHHHYLIRLRPFVLMILVLILTPLRLFSSLMILARQTLPLLRVI